MKAPRKSAFSLLKTIDQTLNFKWEAKASILTQCFGLMRSRRPSLTSVRATLCSDASMVLTPPF